MDPNNGLSGNTSRRSIPSVPQPQSSNTGNTSNNQTNSGASSDNPKRASVNNENSEDALGRIKNRFEALQGNIDPDPTTKNSVQKRAKTNTQKTLGQLDSTASKGTQDVSGSTDPKSSLPIKLNSNVILEGKPESKTEATQPTSTSTLPASAPPQTIKLRSDQLEDKPIEGEPKDQAPTTKGLAAANKETEGALADKTLDRIAQRNALRPETPVSPQESQAESTAEAAKNRKARIAKLKARLGRTRTGGGSGSGSSSVSTGSSPQSSGGSSNTRISPARSFQRPSGGQGFGGGGFAVPGGVPAGTSAVSGGSGVSGSSGGSYSSGDASGGQAQSSQASGQQGQQDVVQLPQEQFNQMKDVTPEGTAMPQTGVQGSGFRNPINAPKQAADAARGIQGFFKGLSGLFGGGRGGGALGAGKNILSGLGGFAKALGLGTKAAQVTATTAAAAGATAPAWGTILLIVVIVIAILLILCVVISLISQPAATVAVSQSANRVGNMRSLRQDPLILPQIQGSRFINSQVTGDQRIIVTQSDAASNITLQEINVRVRFALKSQSEQNNAYFGGGSDRSVFVTSVRLTADIGFSGNVASAQITGYAHEGQGFNESLPATVTGNSISWTPGICLEPRSRQIGSTERKRCLDATEENYSIKITFATPVSLLEVGRPSITLKEKYGLFITEGRDPSRGVDRTGEVTPPIVRCVDITRSNGNFVDCRAEDNTQDARNADQGNRSPGSSGADPGPVTGQVINGCAFAYNRDAGEQMVCTSGFNSTRRTSSGVSVRHNAVDVDFVRAGSSENIRARTVVSPVNGTITATNADNPDYYQACGLVIKIRDDANPEVVHEFHHIEWKGRQGLPAVGQKFAIGDNVGQSFDPGNDRSRFYGNIGLCWAGVHIHYTLTIRGTPVDPEAGVRNACNEQRFVCPRG